MTFGFLAFIGVKILFYLFIYFLQKVSHKNILLSLQLLKFFFKTCFSFVFYATFNQYFSYFVLVATGLPISSFCCGVALLFYFLHLATVLLFLIFIYGFANFGIHLNICQVLILALVF